MSKYNVKEKKDKAQMLTYRRSITQTFVEETAKKIIQRLMIEQKYRDPKYSAKLLAQEIGVNMRHISAVINMRFQQNYAELVSRMRVYEAKYMLGDRNFDDMTVEDIAVNVGFSTRQNFYVAFYKLCGITPKEYRMTHGFVPKAELPQAPKPKKIIDKKPVARKTKE